MVGNLGSDPRSAHGSLGADEPPGHPEAAGVAQSARLRAIHPYEWDVSSTAGRRDCSRKRLLRTAAPVGSPVDGLALLDAVDMLTTEPHLRMPQTSRRVGRMVVVLALAGFVAGCTAAPTAHVKLPPARAVAILVGHSGRWLTNSHGQVVILHGLNMVYKRPPYEPQAAGFGTLAASTLATDGFDVVRLGVIYSAVEPEPGVFSRAYVDAIARTVAELAHDGVYSLLDFHQDQMSTRFGGEGFPSWSVKTGGLPVRRYVFPLGYTESPALDAAYDNFWADRPGPGGVGLQQRYAAAWQYVAKVFADDPWVLGYDLFNEPWPAHSSNAQLGAFYSRVIAAIRAVDSRHLIFYEPFVLFDFGVPTQLPRFADSNLGMSFHDYCLSDARTDPGACSRSEQQVIANALARSASTGSALVLSEFGATDDRADLHRVATDADAHQISWIEWAYCGCEDPTGTIPPSIEGLVSNPRLAGTGGNVNRAKLAVLAEPYPRLVSGTPVSYSFDLESGVFNLTYTTRGPRGNSFSAGSCTAVVVPPFQFPHGYEVVVHGARVTSTPDAGVLTISQLSNGGRTIHLEIRPAHSGPTTVPRPAALTGCA
jgi:endoglycosylceramidase